MSECKYKIGLFCSRGHFNNQPSKDDCASCMDYEGKPRGFGDKVNRLAKATGIEAVAKRVEKKTGKPCGCGKRRAKLNKMFPVKDDS